MKYLEHPYWQGYRSSKDGTILGKRGEPLQPILHHTGYEVITVRSESKQFQMRAHRLIWECHNGTIKDLSKVINHIDGDKRNNSLDNLELVTSSENAIHAFSMGLRSGDRGESNPGSKLTNDQAYDLINMIKQGFSNKHIGELFKLHPNYISLIRHRKRWAWLWDEIEGLYGPERSTTIP